MEEHGFVVAVYESKEAVQAALAELQKVGFNVKQISVVGKLNGSKENAVAGPAEIGAIDVQPQTQAAPNAKVPDAAGSSILIASLNSVGVLKENAQRYEDAVNAGKFLVVAEGTSPNVTKAEQALQAASHAGVALHTSKQAASIATS